jgi:hypothetical protein
MWNSLYCIIFIPTYVIVYKTFITLALLHQTILIYLVVHHSGNKSYFNKNSEFQFTSCLMHISRFSVMLSFVTISLRFCRETNLQVLEIHA